MTISLMHDQDIARCRFFLLVGLFLLEPIAAYALQAGRISLPSGWDDHIIERIKSGKSPRLVLAVLNFEGDVQLQGKIGLKPSDILTTALVKSGRFDMVERDKIDRVIQEQKFQLSDLVDNAKAVEVGKLLGAEGVVFGSITSVSQTKIDKFAYDVIKTEIGIDVRVVGTETGRILFSETASGTTEEKIITTASGTIVSGSMSNNSSYVTASRMAIDSLAARLQELTVLLGFVVDISNNLVTIDIGEEGGVKPGFRFVVLRPSSELLHPVTKKKLGWKKEILCEIEVASTEKTMASCKVVARESTSEVQPGDYVILRTTLK